MMIDTDGKVISEISFHFWQEKNSKVIMMTLDSNPPDISAFVSLSKVALKCDWVSLDKLNIETKND